MASMRYLNNLARSGSHRSVPGNNISLPAPVILNLDRVRPGIEKDLSSGNSDPSGRGRQGNLATSSAIQHNSCVLVSIGPVVNDV